MSQLGLYIESSLITKTRGEEISFFITLGELKLGVGLSSLFLWTSDPFKICISSCMGMLSAVRQERRT
ncbi:hypothetical protein DSUL_30114 [Desulfovibrionales bacterium]